MNGFVHHGHPLAFGWKDNAQHQQWTDLRHDLAHRLQFMPPLGFVRIATGTSELPHLRQSRLWPFFLTSNSFSISNLQGARKIARGQNPAFVRPDPL
jgi:hypothetical protein